jgi:hypothetical protein
MGAAPYSGLDHRCLKKETPRAENVAVFRFNWVWLIESWMDFQEAFSRESFPETTCRFGKEPC